MVNILTSNKPSRAFNEYFFSLVEKKNVSMIMMVMMMMMMMVMMKILIGIIMIINIL